MANFFVTGTDTDVGKTVACAALISLLKMHVPFVLPMKPIQTGCYFSDNQWKAPDIEFLKNACGLSLSTPDYGYICPYRFEPACSPHLAAKKAGVSICLDLILENYQYLTSLGATVVVEGAGGILVPIHDSALMIDLMKAMNIPVILVSRPGLGTINHTLLSIRELRREGLTIAGVLFCETAKPIEPYINEDNRDVINRLGEVPILGTIPFVEDMVLLTSSAEKFRNFCTEHLPHLVHNVVKER